MNRSWILGIGFLCIIVLSIALLLLFIRPSFEEPVFGQSVEELNSSAEDLLEGVVMHFSPEVRQVFESSGIKKLDFEQVNLALREESRYQEILSTYFPGSDPMQKNGGLTGRYLVFFEIGERGESIFTVDRVEP